jgi:hypothetical protein
LFIILLSFCLLCTGFDIRIEAYPDSAQRLNFARTYLASVAFAAKLVDTNADGGCSDGASPMRSVAGGISFTDPGFVAALAAVDATNEATSLAHEAHCYELAAHLTWAIWGVCQVCLILSYLLRLVALIGIPYSMPACLYCTSCRDFRPASRKLHLDFLNMHSLVSASFVELLPKLDSKFDCVMIIPSVYCILLRSTAFFLLFSSSAICFFHAPCVTFSAESTRLCFIQFAQ